MNLNRETKTKLGCLLLKLHRREYGLNSDEWTLVKILEDKKLVRYNGPDASPRIMEPGEFRDYLQFAALSHHELTGDGVAFVLQHSERNLEFGRFHLPGELPWYDRWPWKLLVPAIVSVIVSLIVWAIKG